MTHPHEKASRGNKDSGMSTTGEYVVIVKAPEVVCYGPFQTAGAAEAYEAAYPLQHPEWTRGSTFCARLRPPERWFSSPGKPPNA
jgi:hypothetical protein